MYAMTRAAGNPGAMIQTLLNSNPNFQSVMSLVNQQYGGDSKAAFYDMARQRGVDPNQVLSMLRQSLR